MHYSDDELATFIKDSKQVAEHGAIASHLANCAECRETLALFEEMDGAFGKAEVWEQVPVFRRRPPRAAELLAEKRRIERQNAEALRRLAPHLKSPMHFEDAAVAGNSRFHDAGVVRMLTARAASLHESQPKFALLLATAACFVARKLDSEPPQSQQLLLASALRERANALRLAGNCKDTIAALDEAEPLFRQLPDAPFELAIVDYIRGSVLLELDDRSDEALDLARRAVPVFRQFGDQRRELSARLLEGLAQSNLQRHAAAAEAFERVIALALRLREPGIAAHAYHDAATEYAELRDLEKAERYYMEALTRHDELGNVYGKTNTEWELARLLVLRGDLEHGAKALDLARRRLLELGLRLDHALATLDWAEARLALEKPAGVAAACQEIMLRYESEGATRNARYALACIQEALRQGKATPNLAHEVRTYLQELLRNPSHVFQPVT